MVLINISSESQVPEDCRIYYGNPIELDGDYEIGLIAMSLWNSWHNIAAQFDNNRLKYFDGSTWKTVIFPDGNYTLREINIFIRHSLKEEESSIVLDANRATSRFILLLKNNFKVDLSEGKLYEILGFEPKVYDEEIQEGEKSANISRNINAVYVHCSIIDGSYVNGTKGDVIYSFTSRSRPGAMIIEKPNFPIYLPVNVNNIREIRMQITDQLQRPINLNGEHVSYMLHLRRK